MMTGNKEIDGILKKLSKYTGSVKVDLYPESKKPRIKVTAPDGSVDYFFMEDRDTFYWQSGSWNHGNVDAKKVVRTLIYVLVNYIYLNKIPDGETVQWGGHWFESDGKRLFYTQAQSVKKENKTLTDKEKLLVKEYAKKLIGKKRLSEAPTQSTAVKFAKAIIAINKASSGHYAGEVAYFTSEMKKADLSDKIQDLFDEFNVRFDDDNGQMLLVFQDDRIIIDFGSKGLPEMNLSALSNSGIVSIKVEGQAKLYFNLK